MKQSKWMLWLFVILVASVAVFVLTRTEPGRVAAPQEVADRAPSLLATALPQALPTETPATETVLEVVAPTDVSLPGTFEEWLRKLRSEPAAQDTALGLKLAEARRERMASLIQNDPEKALAEALTPRMYADLPPEIQARVERPVVAEGFYGVLAVCSHGEGDGHSSACTIQHEVILGFGTFEAEVFRASIYGQRKEKLTVEQDSIFGVVMDGHMALHESEVVIVDDGEGQMGGRYAVYYKGQVAYAETLENAEALAQRFLNTSGAPSEGL